MKYIGNYKDWIDPKWIDFILSTPGKAMPKTWEAETPDETFERENVRRAGYDMNATQWWFYFENNLPFKIEPPWCKKNTYFWFAKMTPGQQIPLHRDPVTFPCKRYWMAMQDYEPGHVFVYGDKGEMLIDYKMGDLYEFDDPQMIHGAANVSFTSRIVLQVAEALE
jgi:hypothetical protein